MKKYCSTLLASLLTAVVFAQLPPNDLCQHAIPISPGQILWSESNAGGTTSHDETPEGEPVTCIKTFENDLWYQFVGDSAFQYYEVVITPKSCATPAGLQALIIEADDCGAESFIYRACANPYAEKHLRLFLRNPIHAQSYFIYVDGYDGNICTFDLELIGHASNPLKPQDYLRLQNDYDDAPPYFEPNHLQAHFENNEVTISWEVDAKEPVRLFLVERMQNGSSPYGRVMQVIEAEHTVGQGNAHYQYTDNRTHYQDGESYCYRIVKVGEDDERAFGKAICIEADMVKSLEVTRVFVEPGTRQYRVLYTNYKKQDLTFSLLDADKTYLKGTKVERCPKGSNQMQIDLSDYPPGTYYLKVEGKDAYYLREFIVSEVK